jgi:hypothetical protein
VRSIGSLALTATARQRADDDRQGGELGSRRLAAHDRQQLPGLGG